MVLQAEYITCEDASTYGAELLVDAPCQKLLLVRQKGQAEARRRLPRSCGPLLDETLATQLLFKCFKLFLCCIRVFLYDNFI